MLARHNLDMLACHYWRVALTIFTIIVATGSVVSWFGVLAYDAHKMGKHSVLLGYAFGMISVLCCAICGIVYVIHTCQSHSEQARLLANHPLHLYNAGNP